MPIHRPLSRVELARRAGWTSCAPDEQASRLAPPRGASRVAHLAARPPRYCVPTCPKTRCCRPRHTHFAVRACLPRANKSPSPAGLDRSSSRAGRSLKWQPPHRRRASQRRRAADPRATARPARIATTTATSRAIVIRISVGTSGSMFGSHTSHATARPTSVSTRPTTEVGSPECRSLEWSGTLGRWYVGYAGSPGATDSWPGFAGGSG